MDFDTSPSKRRKLSPAASVAISATSAQSPSKVPKDGRTTPTFMSPTKASLTRFNPALLPPPKPISNIPDDSAGRRRKSLSPRRPGTATLQSPGRAATASPARRTAGHPGAAVAAFTPLKVPSQGMERPLDQRSAAPEETPSRLRQNASQGGEDLAPGQELTRIPTARPDDSEIELPPTPEQLGLQPPSDPPKGLLSSSPLKPKSGRLSKGIGSSPLKPKEALRETTNEALQAEQPEDTAEDLPSQPEDDRRRKREDLARAQELQRKRRTLEQLQKQRDRVRSDLQILFGHANGNDLLATLESPVAFDLLNVLTAEYPSHQPLRPVTRPSFVSKKLASFLPLTRPPEPQRIDANARKQLLSYAPIDGLDPPSYRSAFTPFTLHVTQSDPNRFETNSSLVQDIALTSFKSILEVQFRISTDPKAGRVTSIKVTHISPWADAELGQWLRTHASTGDVASLGWAAGRFWEEACRRAAYWACVRRLFPHLIGGKGSSEGDAAASEAPTTDEPAAPLTLRALRMGIGRTGLRLARGRTALLLTWHIASEGSGEVVNRVDVAAAYPRAWEKVDERASLATLKDVFHRLRERSGIVEATRVLVGIMFPDD